MVEYGDGLFLKGFREFKPSTSSGAKEYLSYVGVYSGVHVFLATGLSTRFRWAKARSGRRYNLVGTCNYTQPS